MTPDIRPLSYDELIASRPDLFVNDPAGGITLLTDPAAIAEIEQIAKRELAAQQLPESWGEVGIVYQDPYILLCRDAVRWPTGPDQPSPPRAGTYIRVIPRGTSAGVVVLPVWQGQIVFLRIYRHASRRYFLEVPRGFAAPGHSPDEDARRELWEEIRGVPLRDPIPIGDTYADTGLLAGRVHLFFTELSSFGDTEIAEAIECIELCPVEELDQWLVEGRIEDGFSLAAIAQARARALI